jgi:hypothetical protein
MRHTYFEIFNFKGIESARLDLSSTPQGRIYTLVGLNESGKTTVLEALKFLSYRTEDLDPLDILGYSVDEVHELIPIGKRANFNDSVRVNIGYEADDEDRIAIQSFVKETFDSELISKIDKFEIQRFIDFVDSTVVSSRPRSTWSNFDLVVKRKGARKTTEIKGEDWRKVVEFVVTLLPSILYFPNFLFDIPDRIILADEADSEKEHKFFRKILQDVLDAVDNKLDLERHVLERMKSRTPNDKRALESTLLKMGSNITKVVLQSWNEIFNRDFANKEFVVQNGQDERGLWYIELKLKDGIDLYRISERSLGFRWFFAFALLTQYRAIRKSSRRNVLFLLDEPASNLHPSAQGRLLHGFSNLPSYCSIIYTTHSQYMINTDWLENTYVVKNEGMDYDAADDGYSAKDTRVTLTRYREFVASHPNQTTYYQPILDTIDYVPALIENVPSVVMVEGKNDYFAFNYIQNKFIDDSSRLSILPGTGSGNLDAVIRLYLAWARPFIVLLDADRAGNREKARYEKSFGILANGRLFTLSDIEPNWADKAMEDLFEAGERLAIQQVAFQNTSSYDKNLFNRAIQELHITNELISLSPATIASFKKILDFCNDKLGKMTGQK